MESNGSRCCVNVSFLSYTCTRLHSITCWNQRYTITLIFDLTRLRMRALQIRFGRFIRFFIVRRTVEKTLTFNADSSEPTIHCWRTHHALSRRRCIAIMRQNTGSAGGNLQNLSHRRANQRRWRDSGERIRAILLSIAIASWWKLMLPKAM